MTAPAEIYKGYTIWRDAFRWVVRSTSGPERFRSLKAAKAFIDRNPRDAD